MRMWKVDPSRMCRQHLLGEHLEMHMFVGAINKGYRLDGYIRNGLVEIEYLIVRHDALVQEMINRGYQHRSPLPEFPGWKAGRVSIRDNEKELGRRCQECKFKSKPNRRKVKMETNAQKSKTVLTSVNLRSLAVELNRCGLKALTGNFLNSKLPKETLVLDLEDAINEIFIANREAEFFGALQREESKAALDHLVAQREKRLAKPVVVEPEVEEPKPEVVVTEASPEHLVFLDNLRDSGVTNMFGAAPYLVDAFGLDKKSARAILKAWMGSFSERHPKVEKVKEASLANVEHLVDKVIEEVAKPPKIKADKKPAGRSKTPAIIQNGIRKPKPEGKCGQAWAIFDHLLHDKGEVDSTTAVEWAVEGGLNPGNVKTELYCWRKFHGLTKPKKGAVENVG